MAQRIVWGERMKKSLAVFLVLCFFGCGGGGGGDTTIVPPPPPPAPPSATDAFSQSIQGLSLDDFYRVSFRELSRRSPESVVWQALEATFTLDGIHLDDISDPYRRDTFEMHEIALDVLRSYDRAPLTADEQLNYDVYEWYLQDVVDQLEFIYYDFPATYGNFGIPRTTQRFFSDIHPVSTMQDADDYLTRLTEVDRKFSQLEAHLIMQRDQAAVVEPALTMQVALNQIAAVASTNAGNHPYFVSFSSKVDAIPGLNTSQRNVLKNRALGTIQSEVIPAYQRLRSTLQNLISNAPADIGVGQYGRGTDYYAYALRHHTTTNLTAAEIHQLGLDELVRIHAEMRAIFDQLGYPQNETLPQLFARVESDGGIVAAADSLATFENLVAFAEANLNLAFDVFPSAPVIVAPDPFGGFYIAPSFDGSRPGAFYAGTDFDQPYFQMPSLTFHESLPGHHTQIAIAMDQDVPAFRKIVRTTAFVEGWALYAERLAYELGWYDNDVYGNLGRLQYEALRAARLVMDTGIHSLGWSFEQATQFNEANVGWSRGASEGAAGRYSVWPGQATAYMVGMLQILTERQRAMDVLGADFDLIAFHRALLTNGGVPLALLRSVVDRYIADAQSGT